MYESQKEPTITIPPKITVELRPQAGCFVIKKDGQLAVLEYQLADGKIIFTHTGVPDALGGKGIGSLLARAGLNYARTQSLTVVSLCSFITGYIQKHPEYQELVEKDSQNVLIAPNKTSLSIKGKRCGKS
jgi:predicted GNAT family acetyltransferase